MSRYKSFLLSRWWWLRPWREALRLAEGKEGSDGCLGMVADALQQIGCSHGPDTRASTPPMMYPEWIQCCLCHHTQRFRDAIGRMASMAGGPDAAEACRAIIAEAAEVMKKKGKA